MPIDGNTKMVAVLGRPISHTASPAMHNAAFESYKMNWAYIALEVDSRQLGTVLSGLAYAGFVGVNLTVPHKLLALQLVDEVDSTAKKIGGTNTIQFKRSKNKIKTLGFNTDGYGLLRALKESFAFNPKGKTIAIVGCGGAGQGAAVQLALAGARKLILLNRTRSKATHVAKIVRKLKKSIECTFEIESCDLVIQATSLGLNSKDPLPLTQEDLRSLNPDYFYDMIYRPAQTPIMKLAGRLRIRTSNGLGMLLHQGAKSFEIWTGKKAPLSVMRRALYHEIYG
jgi:shikimate dehydrogenase